MLVPAVADAIAATFQCRKGCGRRIEKGEAVLHLKLGTNFDYDNRHHYFHLSCVVETVKEAEELVPSVVDAATWVAQVRAKMIETGQFLVDV